MAALRKPADLGPPVRDELPVRSVSDHQDKKGYYLCRYTDSAATATKDAFAGARTYVEPYAASGICEDRKTKALSWGSALVAVQVDNPFDLYVLNDIDSAATEALATRIERLGIPYASVIDLDLHGARAFTRATEISEMHALGPKIVVTTGDANYLPRFVKFLQPKRARRYTLGVIDPCSATFAWDSMMDLAYAERAMDVLSLFPRSDLLRGMRYYFNDEISGRKLDRYFGTIGWRDVVAGDPKHCEDALLSFYEKRIESMLDMRCGQPKSVGPTRNSPFYYLMFASKNTFGTRLWNEVTARAWDGQDEFYFPGV